MQSLELSRKLEGVSKTSIRGTLRSLSWKAVCGESRLHRLEGEQGYSLRESPALPSSNSRKQSLSITGLDAEI